MADRLELPRDKHLAERVIQADADRQLRDMGKIGQIFGSKENVSVYFAGTLVAMALIISCVVAVHEPTLRADALKGILAIGATALGYLLGSGGKK